MWWDLMRLYVNMLLMDHPLTSSSQTCLLYGHLLLLWAPTALCRSSWGHLCPQLTVVFLSIFPQDDGIYLPHRYLAPAPGDRRTLNILYGIRIDDCKLPTQSHSCLSDGPGGWCGCTGLYLGHWQV